MHNMFATDQSVTTRLVNLLSVSLLMMTFTVPSASFASVIELNSPQNSLKNSTLKLEIKLVNDSIPSDPSIATSSSSATAVAKQFFKELEEIGHRRMEPSQTAYHQHQTRRTFLDSFDLNEDVDLLDRNDKGAEDIPSKSVVFDGGNNAPKPSTEREQRKGPPSNIKATDYVVYSPSSLSRSGKSSKHSDNNGISGNGKRVLKIIKSSAVLPKFIIHQPLHSKNRPAVSFEVNSNNIMFIFEIDKEESEKYLINVVVEKMNCMIDFENETASPKLYISGIEHEVSLCKTFDYSLNNYQSVDYLTSGETFFSIVGKGDWTNTSASLVASIYTEASSCRYCPEDHFCCGRKDTVCKYSMMMSSGKGLDKGLLSGVNTDYTKSTKHRSRCIPKLDADGASMICNGHPNCGFGCNLDELGDTCQNVYRDDTYNNDTDDSENCPGYTCREYQQDRFMITLLLLILFCVFVPFCIFLFFCSRKELRREFGRRGRCPLPLEIIFCPFSISPDDPNNPGSVSGTPTNGPRQTRNGTPSRTRGNARRNFRRSEEVNSGRDVTLSGVGNPGFFDDLPPPYSECYNNKDMFPNPPRVNPFNISSNFPIVRDSTNTRNTREITSTFQLQPIIAVVPGLHRTTQFEVGASPSQTQTATTSLTCSNDPAHVRVTTTNETV